ncbi:hypothetical protein U8C35_17645 [Sinorhizobium medicae]|uniref:hypothetical protein n=1 Tax=Sinorhizobium medicae TaxID=110321 RepID=UPI002AF6B726|nr:hypothetical protein [Sinorhizobium medicae]WQO60874.1 hypothetical protein U8C35_17645 [Sinorhizobium medicae]
MDLPIRRAAAEKPSASTTSMKARMRVKVSMIRLSLCIPAASAVFLRLFSESEHRRSGRGPEIFIEERKKLLITTMIFLTYALPKVARACGCPPTLD